MDNFSDSIPSSPPDIILPEKPEYLAEIKTELDIIKQNYFIITKLIQHLAVYQEEFGKRLGELEKKILK